MTDNSAKKNKKVWVELEVNKYTDAITVFRGRIDRVELENWSSGELVDCALKLENTYWIVDNSVCILGDADSVTKNYTGDAYIRVDTIILMFELKDQSSPTTKMLSTDNIFPFPGRTNT